jgi:class 3 adenylate cyclase
MAIRPELGAYVERVFGGAWTTREGRKVPEGDDLKLGNDAVELDAVVLYADLADSTELVRRYQPEFAAEIYKNYLYCAGRIIGQNGGAITAYDGDRVMAVYIGESKNSSAARTALQINWAVDQVINPALKAQYPSSPYVVKQKVGVDASELLVAQTGIRGNHDLVWVGDAANTAAKMAALPTRYASYISEAVYDRLSMDAKFNDGEGSMDMWRFLGHLAEAGRSVYASNWMQDF